MQPVARTWREMRRWPVLPAIVLVGLATLAIFARQIAPYGPLDQNVYARNAPPSWASGAWYAEHPKVDGRYFLGADYVGRDVLSRIIYGARISLMISAIAAGAGMTIGSTVGMVAGYFGGWVDEIVMRLVDAWSCMPFILLALVVAIVLGTSVKTMMIILALVAWESFVRNVRAEVLSLKTRDYVALAKVAGASHSQIIVRHILPGVTNTIVIITTLRLGGLIMGEATLSFLGAGIPSPTPAWGLMVSEGRNYVDTAYWTAMFPGLFILMLVMSFNFIGDWLRDRMDPRLRQL
ncbi:MAG: ABC transporter permease [Chloroflexota bacterium]|nr:ABC transporter permease [Chloroflexota bacterium]